MIPAKFTPRLTYRRQAVLFLMPYLLGTLVLVVIPAVATLLLSFTGSISLLGTLPVD